MSVTAKRSWVLQGASNPRCCESPIEYGCRMSQKIVCEAGPVSCGLVTGRYYERPWSFSKANNGSISPPMTVNIRSKPRLTVLPARGADLHYGICERRGPAQFSGGGRTKVRGSTFIAQRVTSFWKQEQASSSYREARFEGKLDIRPPAI